MLEKDESGFMSETGNWNVAGDYAKTKIMRPLGLADEYQLIATFGTVDFFDELNIRFSVDDLKIKGFIRLINTLIMLIDNSYFAVKKDRGRDDMIKLREELKEIQKILPTLYSYQTNSIKNTKVIKLDSKVYNIFLEKVIEIKYKINEPLNRNHLIFVDRKEFDPREFKEKIKDRMINQG